MSTYLRQTKHPETDEWQVATWADDFYGSHHYGVKFPNGDVFDPEKIKLETRDSEPVKTNYADSRTPEEREADSQIKMTVTTEKRLEKELFEMVYNWGKVGVVTDHECFAFKSTMQEIITQTLAEERERMRGIIKNKKVMAKNTEELRHNDLLDDLLSSLDTTKE